MVFYTIDAGSIPAGGTMKTFKRLSLISFGFVAGLAISFVIYDELLESYKNTVMFNYQQLRKMQQKFEELVQLDDVKLSQHLLEIMLENYTKEQEGK